MNKIRTLLLALCLMPFSAFAAAHPITYSGPFAEGDTRPFRLYLLEGGNLTEQQTTATLRAQGEHVNA
jgi:hypothetical protein